MRKGIGKILKIGTLLSTWGLIAMVLLQIICRFSWFDTPSWTEEASRILFIYAISFASGLALKSSNYYVALDAFYNMFNPKFRLFLDKSIPVVICILFVIFTALLICCLVLTFNKTLIKKWADKLYNEAVAAGEDVGPIA